MGHLFLHFIKFRRKTCFQIVPELNSAVLSSLSSTQIEIWLKYLFNDKIIPGYNFNSDESANFNHSDSNYQKITFREFRINQNQNLISDLKALETYQIDYLINNKKFYFCLLHHSNNFNSIQQQIIENNIPAQELVDYYYNNKDFVNAYYSLKKLYQND